MQTMSGKFTPPLAAKTCFRRFFAGCALFAGLAVCAFAQEVQISFTEGGEFALSSGGERALYQGGRLNTGGLSMKPQDILQTGQDSFVELRLEPGGTRIKIAENTSLVCNGAGPESGTVSFTLLYGRMRLSTAGNWPAGEGNSVYIKTGQAAAVFSGGDAGIDFIANAAESRIARGEPVLTIYCFAGNPELVPPLGSSPGGSGPRLAVREYESLSIETLNPLSYIERRPLDEGIIQYWNRHNFSGGMPLLAARPPAAQPPAATPQPAAASPVQREAPRVVETIRIVPADNSRNKKLNIVKNVFLSTGIGLIVSGVTMQGAGIYQFTGLDTQQRNLLINYGFLPLGLGLLLGGAALAVNPEYPDANAAD